MTQLSFSPYLTRHIGGTRTQVRQCNENAARAFYESGGSGTAGAKADNKKRRRSKECQMNANLEMRPDAAIYKRINAIHMFEGRRRAAIGAMRDAFAFVDVYASIARSVQHAARRLSFRPHLRH
jgi:hypothetical protein